jgi:hypothetical protein
VRGGDDPLGSFFSLQCDAPERRLTDLVKNAPAPRGQGHQQGPRRDMDRNGRILLQSSLSLRFLPRPSNLAAHLARKQRRPNPRPCHAPRARALPVGCPARRAIGPVLQRPMPRVAEQFEVLFSAMARGWLRHTRHAQAPAERRPTRDKTESGHLLSEQRYRWCQASDTDIVRDLSAPSNRAESWCTGSLLFVSCVARSGERL